MSDDRNDAIRKILRCLALSKSSNENEAAIALRQAQALMQKHGIEELDVLAAEASEQETRAGAKSTPANWEERLAHLVARAFGCRLIFQTGGWTHTKGAWLYIGCGSAPEIAGYAFEVLYRQAKDARGEYIKKTLKRCKTANKTSRADLFCEGWVAGVSGKVTSFATTGGQRSAIDAYVSKRFGKLETLDTRDRNEGKKLRDWHHNDLAAGQREGRDAQLHHGVGPGQDQARLPS